MSIYIERKKNREKESERSQKNRIQMNVNDVSKNNIVRENKKIIRREEKHV